MPRRFGLLLAPGAGADSNSPALLAVEKSVPATFTVSRMDFPYRVAGRRAPDKPAVLMQSVRDHLERFSSSSGIPPQRIYVGGRSMGGRMASMAVAEGMTAAGLVLMSYPLHPPGRPAQLRVDHFHEIRLPCLFVSGTRDAFGTRAELSRWAKAIAGPVTFEWIEGGDHGMKKYSGEVAAAVAGWLSRETGRKK